MKFNKLHKTLILALFLFSFILLNPLHFIGTHTHLTSDHKPSLAQPENVLRMGVTALIAQGNWDPVITSGYEILEYFEKNCLEPLIWLPDDSTKPLSQLATDWEYEYWPEDFNTVGFKNQGGIKSVSITLRDGVQFHDGSDWNASVAKWNIDRLYLITGNLTGNSNGIYDQRNQARFWIPIKDWSDFFTPSWNKSEYDAPDAIPPGTPPDLSRYSYYYIGDPASPSSKISNPNPYGGYDPFSLTYTHYSPYDQVPMVRWVNVTEAKQSGGKIKIEFNSWDLSYVNDHVSIPQISMQAYTDYNETGIYGYQNGNDMIGTGPYIYQEFDNLLDEGYMLKNLNYWNRTALEADGWFDADRVELIQFSPGELGQAAQNIALLTHQIDYVYDSMTVPINYSAVMANPYIDYIEYGVSDYIKQITLNSINETWWTGEPSAYFGGVDISSMYPNEQGDPGGIPRVLRKAMSYAFDYDTYISVYLDGRAVRAGGLLGKDNVYYNTSTPIADYNLTKARELLLTTGDDPYTFTYTQENYNFSKLCADRGLTASSTDTEWQTVANFDPIFTLDFYWDYLQPNLNITLKLACNNLGIELVQHQLTQGEIIWNTVRIYWWNNFDGTHSIWSANSWVMDHYMPKTNPMGYVEFFYGDPNNGSWRAPTYNVTDEWPGWNYGFSYDAEIDYWIARAKYSNQTGKQYWLNKITEKEQTELCSMIYVSQAKEGRVLWDDWEVNFNRGDLFFANFRYNGPLPLPGDVALSSDAGIPDIDGNFNLIWNVSVGADSYSIYRYSSLITEINGSLTSIANQNATSPHLIMGLPNGSYYFIVVAHNQAGDTLSNNIHITVQIELIPPSSFVLTSDADFPDDDGIFNLSWTSSDGADNYSIYTDNNPITIIDSGPTLLLDQTALSPFPVSGLPNGEYYFVIVAHNQYGDTSSNNVHVTVNIPGEPTAPAISSYNTVVLMGITVCTAIILFTKVKKKYKR